MSTNMLVISSSVAPVGNGRAGGVDITLASLLNCIHKYGNCKIDILAPKGSMIKSDTGRVLFSSGTCSIPMQHLEPQDKIVLFEDDMSLSFVETAYKVQEKYDLILNLSYDYVPIFMTEMFDVPIFHLISMGNTTGPMNYIINKVYRRTPKRMAFHTVAQAKSFGILDFTDPIYAGFESEKYTFYENSERHLITASRVAPEKGIEDALEVAKLLNLPIKIMGVTENEAYKLYLMDKYKEVAVNWLGFVGHDEFVRKVGNARVAIATPKWDEAMGIANIESTLSGVPVLAYDRGGISEVIFHGKTGFISPEATPTSIAGYYHAALELNRRSVRETAAATFSLEALFGRLSSWFSMEGIEIVS
ncbi:glycosyltransferase [Flexibacterium corallicola]|uniref:glycosyltransferase n=1 Tax=Flexibacterium corallicola TaxID=3037259 RepID=UPI00286F0525|nr:glycosyltransferase [Pseudovibrio sp. M1P-2-3]